MSSPHYEGEVRVGVPHDIVHPFLTPILRRFDRAWPRVRVSLTVSITVKLLEALENGDIDLTLTTESSVPKHAELLARDALCWVGAPDGEAYLRDPLPLSLGDQFCAFRRNAVAALAEMGRDWRPVCETSISEALKVSLEADLAIAPMLRSMVPDGLVVLSPDAGLPPLPDYFINLHMRSTGRTEIAEEFAKFIRREAAARFGTELNAARSAGDLALARQ